MYKNKLREELFDFDLSHTDSSNHKFQADLNIHTIITLALPASITFANALINFISKNEQRICIS